MHTFTVTNVGSGNLVSNGVEVTGTNPGDFRATTDCAKAPVAPGGTCTVSVRFAPAATALRTAVLGLSDNAPRSPQPVTVSGYGGGPGAWVPVGSLPAATEHASAVLLRSGEVLIAGGEDFTGGSIASASLYDPATRTFTATGSLNAARAYATAVLLSNGKVLTPTTTAELYTPALVSLSPTSGPVGTQVTVTGNGYYGHETVKLRWDGGTLLASPKTSADGTFSVMVTIPQASTGIHSINADGRRSFASAFAPFNVTG